MAFSLWVDYGRAQVVHSFIAQIDELAETAFSITALQVSNDVLVQLQAYDREAKKLKFEKDTYMCGACLNPKKGRFVMTWSIAVMFFASNAYRHYNNVILLGNVNNVRCPASVQR